MLKKIILAAIAAIVPLGALAQEVEEGTPNVLFKIGTETHDFNFKPIQLGNIDGVIDDFMATLCPEEDGDVDDSETCESARATVSGSQLTRLAAMTKTKAALEQANFDTQLALAAHMRDVAALEATKAANALATERDKAVPSEVAEQVAALEAQVAELTPQVLELSVLTLENADLEERLAAQKALTIKTRIIADRICDDDIPEADPEACDRLQELGRTIQQSGNTPPVPNFFPIGEGN